MSRKESLKKSLGISEYPWSSDDEEMEVAPTVSELHSARQTSFSETLLSNASGPSTSSASASSAPLREMPFLSFSLHQPPTRTGHRPGVRLTPLDYRSSGRSWAPTPPMYQRFLALRSSRNVSNVRTNRPSGGSSSSRNAAASSALPAEVTAFFKASQRNNMTRWQSDNRAPTLNQAVAGGSGAGGGGGGGGGGQAACSGYRRAPASPTLQNEPVTLDASDDEVFLSTPPRTSNEMEAETLSGPTAISLSEINPEPGPSGTAGNDTNMSPKVEAKSESEETSPSTSGSSEKAVATIDKSLKSGGKRKRESEEEAGSEIVSVSDFNKSLLRLLECPVCLEWMEPPMAQCRRGHLVCGRCRERLASCPVCRTAFSSVRNRAMEGVAEMVRYPCRHGCGREVRLRLRGGHEASCAARRYRCPAAACAHRAPLPHKELATHLQSKHPRMVLAGWRHALRLRLSEERHEDWVVAAQHQLFHLRLDVDIRTWGLVLYVAYIGPKCRADHYTYEVTIVGQHNYRKISYMRATHCDLECSTLNVGRQDCFHITLEQALNFLRESTKHDEHDKYLFIDVEIARVKNDEESEETAAS